jgi:excisionase family DNA binding protein
MPPVARRFCTTREAAEMLGVSLKTAQLWSERGLLEAWRTEGGHRRILRESVDRLLANDPAVAERAAASDDRRFRILVAEDDDALRRLYRLRLARWHLAPAVTVVADGSSALIEIGRRRPDLFIADLAMPEFDGFRLLRALRRAAEFRSMEIVVVTALDRETIASQGDLPADIPVISKPVSFDILERRAEALAAAKWNTGARS